MSLAVNFEVVEGIHLWSGDSRNFVLSVDGVTHSGIHFTAAELAKLSDVAAQASTYLAKREEFTRDLHRMLVEMSAEAWEEGRLAEMRAEGWRIVFTSAMAKLDEAAAERTAERTAANG